MLTFDQFQKINSQRAQRWHPGFPNDASWSGSDWSNAMAGECGEACNIVKKLRRAEDDLVGVLDVFSDELRAMLGEEIADTITYAFLLAEYYGINVGEEIAAKFNKVSAIQHFPERISL